MIIMRNDKVINKSKVAKYSLKILRTLLRNTQPQLLTSVCTSLLNMVEKSINEGLMDI